MWRPRISGGHIRFKCIVSYLLLNIICIFVKTEIGMHTKRVGSNDILSKQTINNFLKVPSYQQQIFSGGGGGGEGYGA